MYYLHFLLTEPKNKLKSFGESTTNGGNYALTNNKMEKMEKFKKKNTYHNHFWRFQDKTFIVATSCSSNSFAEAVKKKEKIYL